MICARFAFSGMPAISRLHVTVELSFDPSGRLTEIGLLASCILFTVVPGRAKCPVATVSAMDSCLDICIADVDYAGFIYL